MPDATPPPASTGATQARSSVTTGLTSVPEGSELDRTYDEASYLAAFPDVAEAVQRGDLGSGLDHYRVAGRKEKRLLRPEYRRALTTASNELDLPAANVQPPGASIDAIVASESGGIFIAGWADDTQQQLTALDAQLGSTRWHWSRFPRLRRADVETAVSAPSPYHYGFWTGGGGDAGARQFVPVGSECIIDLHFRGDATAQRRRPVALRSESGLRDLAMGYLAGSGYYGNQVVGGFASLDAGMGDWLIELNKSICQKIAHAAVVERFGPRRRRFLGSIIVPLYGIADYLFIQNCLYALGTGISDYEFIFVLNSPELSETVQREARICEMVYGLPVSIVVLPDNAGFGVANNIGSRFARSDRILCVNPDVFPRASDWARLHTDAVRSLPANQTRLFGTSLFYDDGSLMHGGMYFEVDHAIQANASGVVRRAIARVEHYGKGAPGWAKQFTTARPVPAVTGAFMSIDRDWFEKLGGFTEDYIFGHYEDADLCLKSLQAGSPVWLHDIPMWHMEGKGSRRLPHHDGGSLLNRWLFTRTWERVIVPDMVGPAPHRQLETGHTEQSQSSTAIPKIAAAMARAKSQRSNGRGLRARAS